MSKGDDDNPARTAAEATRGVETATGATDGILDRWLRQQLRHLYNDVVNEPLPSEFLEILGKIPGGKPET